MSRLSPGQTLQPTALIHEAFLKMHSSEWENERVFFRTAAMAMRSVVLDKIKAKGRLKRGGKNILITLNGLDPEDERAQSPSDILMVEEVLLEIERLDPELKELLLLRYYTGMSFPRIAVLMGIPLRSLERRWQFIRAFVGREQARRTESDSHHGQ
jgi:RNA polymerase sigma factor (TIGR02999 family)